jgi:hypothetical protein
MVPAKEEAAVIAGLVATSGGVKNINVAPDLSGPGATPLLAC